MTYKKMSFIFGVVIFVSLVTFLVSIMWLAEKRIFFTRDYIVYVKFKEIAGLRDHSRVFMRGFKIGWTKDVKFMKDGVLVRVDINKKYKVPKDSKFYITTLNMLGEKNITISPGVSNEYLKNGDVVEGKNRDIILQAQDLLKKFAKTIDKKNFMAKSKKIDEILDQTKELILALNKKIESIDSKKLSNAIENIETASKKFGKVVEENSENIKKSTELAKKNLEELQPVLSNLNSTLKEIRGIINQLNSGKGSAGKMLKDDKYIERLDKAIEELTKLIEDIKKNPKKYFKFSVF